MVAIRVEYWGGKVGPALAQILTWIGHFIVPKGDNSPCWTITHSPLNHIIRQASRDQPFALRDITDGKRGFTKGIVS